MQWRSINKAAGSHVLVCRVSSLLCSYISVPLLVHLCYLLEWIQSFCTTEWKQYSAACEASAEVHTKKCYDHRQEWTKKRKSCRLMVPFAGHQQHLPSRPGWRSSLIIPLLKGMFASLRLGGFQPFQNNIHLPPSVAKTSQRWHCHELARAEIKELKFGYLAWRCKEMHLPGVRINTFLFLI